MKFQITYISKAALLNVSLPVLFVLQCLLASAQQRVAFLSNDLQNISMPSSKPGWIEFKPEVTLNPLTVFSDYSIAFGLNFNDEMRMVNQKPDELGFIHYKYQQYYKGVKIFGAEYIVHQNADGRVYSANGKIVSGLYQGATASIDESNALQIALQETGSSDYYWLSSAREQEIKEKTKKSDATWFPKGEIIFVKKMGEKSWEPQNFFLCWKFDIHVENLHESKTVFIDANNGTVIRTILLNHECSGGTGTTNFNGSVSLNTQLNGGNYRLWDDCQAANIVIRNRNAATNNSSWTEYFDPDNAWTSTADRSGVQAMYGMNQTRLYYSGVHSRNSFDNAGGDIIVYNNAGFFDANNNVYGTNAFASSDGNFYFGYGPSSSSTADDWNSIDVAGHEFTHFVTGNEAGLVYQDESGALNESFSDIFGEMVESYTLGINDYLIGTDIGAIRDMSDPNAFNDPDTYLGSNWCDYTNGGLNCTMNDNGGVHTNSGVQNYFFFLLSEGGSGTNDNGEAFNVTGISRFTAREIGYRALSVYLTSNDAYIDAREAWLRAAFDLYGNCSNEIVQVGNAWRAVGVGSLAGNYINNACGVYPLLSDYAQAISYLQVSNGCITTITPSATTVYFHATDRVRIFPGFTAQAGSKFYAYIQPCDISIWRSGSHMSDSEAGMSAAKDNSIPGSQNVFSLTAAPNPFSDQVEITLKLDIEKAVTLSLFDVSGRLVQPILQNKTVDKGIHTLKIETHQLQPGIYLLSYGDETKTEVLKIAKSK